MDLLEEYHSPRGGFAYRPRWQAESEAASAGIRSKQEEDLREAMTGYREMESPIGIMGRQGMAALTRGVQTQGQTGSPGSIASLLGRLGPQQLQVLGQVGSQQGTFEGARDMAMAGMHGGLRQAAFQEADFEARQRAERAAALADDYLRKKGAEDANMRAAIGGIGAAGAVGAGYLGKHGFPQAPEPEPIQYKL
tara:strand:- start:11282 stop:11863 length:582 start_codon:yes stop_codon:yes gene_type:complete